MATWRYGTFLPRLDPKDTIKKLAAEYDMSQGELIDVLTMWADSKPELFEPIAIWYKTHVRAVLKDQKAATRELALKLAEMPAEKLARLMEQTNGERTNG